MLNSTGFYPRLRVDTATRCSAAGQAGRMVLTDTSQVSGLSAELSSAIGGGANRPRSTTRPKSCWIWRCRWHWTDCLADIAVLRTELVISSSRPSSCFAPRRATPHDCLHHRLLVTGARTEELRDLTWIGSTSTASRPHRLVAVGPSKRGRGEAKSRRTIELATRRVEALREHRQLSEYRA